MSDPLFQLAASFAARAHDGQYRKDGVTPYIAHPFRVAFTVRHVFGCDDSVAIATALLHDTIEDTATDYDDVRDAFGSDIAEAVACLTKDKRLPDEQREPAFYAQIAKGPWQARLVKLADAYDNIHDSNEALRQKALEKGRHALEAAGTDQRLAAARSILEECIARYGTWRG